MQSDGKVPKIKVKVDTKPIEFVIDSGASVIDELTYRKLGVPLSESKIKLYAYGAKKPLCVIGKCYVTIQHEKVSVRTVLHVIK